MRRIQLPALRLSVIFWLLVGIWGLFYFVSHVLAFIAIFFTHAGLPLPQRVAADAFAANATDSLGRPREQLIPKILHQVFHNWHEPGNDELPDDWKAVRQTCIDHNPDWQHMLWTERTSHDFIEKEYPWFLSTYDGYRFPVQRVDAVRYFLLLHYGGIYLDLDNGCSANLEPLLYYPVWIAEPGRGALSNNVLAAAPHHPYWTLLTQSLKPWDYNYLFPYATISYASGQWFETAIWNQYHAMLPSPDKNPQLEHRLYRMMMDDREGSDEWIYFTQERGGSWKNWDNYFFLFIGDHIILFLLTLFGLLGGCGWFILRRYRRRRGYKPLSNGAARHEIELHDA